MAPNRPLPSGNASSQICAGLEYHKDNSSAGGSAKASRVLDSLYLNLASKPVCCATDWLPQPKQISPRTIVNDILKSACGNVILIEVVTFGSYGHKSKRNALFKEWFNRTNETYCREIERKRKCTTGVCQKPCSVS